MGLEKDGCAIPESERYTFEKACDYLMRLSNNGTPLPLIMKELYGDRRIVVYTTKAMCEQFKGVINAFLFYYGHNIVFCSDSPFHLWGGGLLEWDVSFQAVRKVQFQENDLFFAFDLNFPAWVNDYVQELKVSGLRVAVFGKPFIGALYYYIYRVRPLKNFLALNPCVKVVLIDSFVFDASKATPWEKYLIENKLTRENFLKRMQRGEYPYPEGQYSKQYTPAELLQMHYVPHRFTDTRGVVVIEDYASKYINIENGRRRTVGQPKEFKRTVHIFGGCDFFGVGMPDESTFASVLQALCNEKCPEKALKVENHAYFLWGLHDAMWYLVDSVSYADGDIVVIPYNQRWAKFLYKNIPNVIYADVTKRRGGEMFNDMWHPSENGIRTYAENLFDFLYENNFLEKMEPEVLESVALARVKQYGIPPFADSRQLRRRGVALSDPPVGLDAENFSQLNDYLATLAQKRPKIGAIVMNCNPFTLGHRYLIEYASSRVDRLYIFAVEEDKSYFPFKDRIELMQQGTADLPNVTVIPSGKFIVSALTFTDYFGKAELQDKTIDASMDLEIFGQYIAPALGITVRFAGEEPLDKVTKQYNEHMRRILPKYGVKFEEVPRKEEKGGVISASRVRKLLETKDFAEIQSLVPRTTYDYLIKRFG